MTQDAWGELVRAVAVAGYREKVSDWLILTPDTGRSRIRESEAALAGAGLELPAVALELLDRWNEVGPRLLLETVPRLVNPGITNDDLNPTGKSMQELFPDFCSMVEHTRHLAILVDQTGANELLIAGRADQRTKPQYGWPWSVDGRRPWAYYLPWLVPEVRRWEQQSQIRLSPQMRQMYLRTRGAPEMVDPDFIGPPDMAKGALYTGLYERLVDQIPLGPAIVERLQAFVVLNFDIFGDDIGFFADEERDDGEYTIYRWSHETVEFERYADDFAGAVQDLVGYAVADDE